MSKLEQKTRKKIAEIYLRLAVIEKDIAILTRAGEFEAASDLSSEKSWLIKKRAKLENGGQYVCPECGDFKSPGAEFCGSCYQIVLIKRADAALLAAFYSPEAAEIRKAKHRSRRKPVERYLRAFQRWRRWRRRSINGVSRGVSGAANVCACGSYKTTSATRCTECKDAKRIFRKRMPPAPIKAVDDPQIEAQREPRALRILTPSLYETDADNSWDNIVRLFEDN